MISSVIGNQNSLARKKWNAAITDLTPSTYRMESEDGEYVAGIVTFEPIGTSRTMINLKPFYDSKRIARS
jgi:hypothetical protein